jgi:hypothetical protein
MKTNHFFYYIYILSIFFASLLNAQDEDFTKYYKVEDYEERIACLKPYMIEGLDNIYIKNPAGEVVYLIQMIGSKGSCSYKSKRLIFKKNTSQDIINKALDSFDNKIEMDQTFYISFKIKKLKSDGAVAMDSINVPYFIVIKDKSNDNIVLQKDYSINIPLKNYASKIYDGKSITIKETFSAKSFGNMELMSGIYFKGNTNNEYFK